MCTGNAGQIKGVVDLYPEAPERAFNLGLSGKPLNRPQVASALVDHGGFYPPRRESAEEARI